MKAAGPAGQGTSRFGQRRPTQPDATRGIKTSLPRHCSSGTPPTVPSRTASCHDRACQIALQANGPQRMPRRDTRCHMAAPRDVSTSRKPQTSLCKTILPTRVRQNGGSAQLSRLANASEQTEEEKKAKKEKRQKTKSRFARRKADKPRVLTLKTTFFQRMVGPRGRAGRQADSPTKKVSSNRFQARDGKQAIHIK